MSNLVQQYLLTPWRWRGVRYLEVDASDDSAPILRRLGFRAVTTTTPYVWMPPAPGLSPA
jgi:hypothetical protein